MRGGFFTFWAILAYSAPRWQVAVHSLTERSIRVCWVAPLSSPQLSAVAISTQTTSNTSWNRIFILFNFSNFCQKWKENHNFPFKIRYVSYQTKLSRYEVTRICKVRNWILLFLRFLLSLWRYVSTLALSFNVQTRFTLKIEISRF